MSGHSRWAGIKHKKAIVDAKKGKAFTKLIKEITIAARMGGGSPETNPRLRKAIEDGREANMPQDNIKKAIQRGTGELPGATIEEVRYEGYGPGGVAIIVEGSTDNKNRTTSEIRKMFSEHGGNMGESGCVSWIFESKGYIAVPKKGVDEEALTNLAIELGAEDIKSDDDLVFEITTAPHDFEKIKTELQKNKFPMETAEVTLIPKNTVPVDGDTARKCLELMEALEDHEDVKTAYANFDIPQEVLQKK